MKVIMAEDEVYAIWRELLGAPDLGIDENFFDAGGTSILATRLAARLRLRFSKPVTVQQVFLFPTVRALTEEICGSHPPKPNSPSEDRAFRQRQAFDRLRMSQHTQTRV